MKLRKLLMKDAPLMLEWMHDDTVIHDMKTNFAIKTITDCETFIQSAEDITTNLHLAIVDDTDTYMGTVSLKHIDNKIAEFGITVRKCAMGLGYSDFGMKEIIETGLEKLNLKKIYWCVSPQNKRALRFYDKNHYARCKAPLEAKNHYTSEEMRSFIWYSVINN